MSCQDNQTPVRRGSGALLVIVLYILLVIILGSNYYN